MKFIQKLRNFFDKYPRVTMFGALSLSITFFLIICLSKIDAWSVWFDESFSVFMVKQDFGDIWHFTALDVNAPFYYFLLKGWSFIVGYGDVALRLLSVIFGIGSIIGGFFLTRRMFGRRIGYFALLFLTLSPMLLRYATEIRCYTLLIFLLIMATYVFVLASEKSSRKLWILYGVLIALAMWTHYYAALPIMAHLLWRAMTIKKKFFSRDFVTSLAVAAALFLPWLPVVVKQFTTVQSNGFWIPPFGFDTVGNFLGETMAYNMHDKIQNFVALGLVMAIILLVILFAKSHRTLAKKVKQNTLLMLLLAFLPPAILAILSMPPLRPMFINRYVIFSMVMFSVLAALAVGTKLKTRLLKNLQVALFAIMLTLSGWATWNVLHYGNYNFDTNSVSMAKSLMKKIADKSSEKTVIIAESPWIFYDANVYETEQNPVYFLDSSTEYQYGSLAMLQADNVHKITDLESFVRFGQRVWYIGTTDDDALSLPIENWRLLQTISISDPIDGRNNHKAAEYIVE